MPPGVAFEEEGRGPSDCVLPPGDVIAENVV